MIGELCGDLKIPQYQDTTLNVLFFSSFFSLHVGLCQQNVHFLIIRSSKERRSCDTWPCHTHTHMFKQTCLWMYGLVALHLPLSPTAAWILTGWEECGNPHLWSCRVAASSSSPYIPCLSGFQPGLTCEPGRGPLALPTICLRWPNFETCLLVSAIAAFDTPPSVSQSLRSSYGETYTSGEAVHALRLSPSMFTPTPQC